VYVSAARDIPLFPLRTVLFPGGLLPLRIFEARYVDMVGRCMRLGEAFGVVLLESGAETAGPVATAAVGTSARIVDFQTLPDGLLGLLCRGERRFRIVSRRVQADGLHCADVEWLASGTPAPVAQEFQPLVPVLRECLANMGPMSRFIEPRYGDADWVGQRFAELLPLEPAQQQQLLELEDPNECLRLLAPMIEATP
jgi:Lon protease-like protein